MVPAQNLTARLLVPIRQSGSVQVRAPSVEDMFDLINGLPVHPLVVHAVVVLLPLATLGTIALVVRPAWRRPYGPLLVAIAAVATVLIPVATSSGEALEKHVGDPGEQQCEGDRWGEPAGHRSAFRSAGGRPDRSRPRASATVDSTSSPARQPTPSPPETRPCSSPT